MTVQDIYNAIDAFAPFHTQEKWDNSGLLVGSMLNEARKVLVTLDISDAAFARAQELGCNVIVSHHPVIFTPLKTLVDSHIVCNLVRYGMSAICCHTPLDLAPGGLNDLLADRLKAELPVAEIKPLLDDGLGRLLTLREPQSEREIAAAAKRALGCQYVRYLPDHAESPYIEHLAVCTGSGSSLLEEIADTCECLLTGDVKHDRWYRAQELSMGLIDCGHYSTEVIMVPYAARKLREALPGLEVIEFMEGEPAAYV